MISVRKPLPISLRISRPNSIEVKTHSYVRHGYHYHLTIVPRSILNLTLMYVHRIKMRFMIDVTRRSLQREGLRLRSRESQIQAAEIAFDQKAGLSQVLAPLQKLQKRQTGSNLVCQDDELARALTS